MADNVAITAGTGTDIKTDQLTGGAHVQYVKLMDGTADGDTPIAGDGYGLDTDVTRLGRSFSKTDTSGSGAIDVSATSSGDSRLVSVTVHLSAAPTSAGSLTIVLNANSGSAYDTTFLSQSMVSCTSLVFMPDGDIFLEDGDAIDVDYSNPDSKTYGVQITLEAV